VAEGEARGKAEGRVEGELKEAQSLILRQLNRRVGNMAPELESRVKSLPLERLEALGEALLDFSGVGDLESWLG
jgi:predicted transposase YdaD